MIACTDRLSELMDWSADEVTERLGPWLGKDALSWILELVEPLEALTERRGMAQAAPELLLEADGDVRVCREAMSKPPYGSFTPLELAMLGLIDTSIALATENLGTEEAKLLKDRRERSPYSKVGPRHARPGVIHLHLSGALGLQMAQRWEEHLAKCESCREHAAHVGRDDPDDEFDA